jgi:thiamine biosynthesis lipoprotein
MWKLFLNFNWTKTTLLISIVVFFSACGLQKEVLLTGKTMGTTYHITVVTGYFSGLGELKDNIERRLQEINQSMSTYIKDSEISRFNTSVRAGEKFSISDDFFYVVSVGKRLYTLTNGAWDGTIKPLVDLWGFSGSNGIDKIPSAKEIQKALLNTGFEHIKILPDRSLVKSKDSVSLDFASIAKGFAVDQIAAIIKNSGRQNFLVEIGGEGYAAGVRRDGKPWKIGINLPDPAASPDQAYKILALRNEAFATSGDYRNFFEYSGQRFSHVLDPRKGFPVANGVVSVSILATTCTFADGLATAVMVMGREKGLDLVNRLDNIECLIIVRKDGAGLVDYYSNGLDPTGS